MNVPRGGFGFVARRLRRSPQLSQRLRCQDLEEVFCEDLDPLQSAKASKKVTSQAPGSHRANPGRRDATTPREEQRFGVVVGEGAPRQRTQSVALVALLTGIGTPESEWGG